MEAHVKLKPVDQTCALRAIWLGGSFTARKRSLGQGNIFAPVCHSVHRGGVCSGGCLVWGVSAPGRGDAWSGGVPGAREGCSQGGVPCGDPPGTATAAGGTHPTVMHSCLK